MYVKNLTLKGFKSFASATHLRLEPGITCIVGPNGSGKSNVVDALAWVMGEQGAKSLRGGKMEDVIFAGTSGRPALGRAEVSMTIDNTDGALPIDYTEVTISRTMFRGGGSDYAINGTSCRLVDIQELLSDSGIGREMHVIVGQGQLDAVLRASPEERRGFVEEAAGVLKHRKRKEKALRKLEAMEGNLTRVKDLTAELRRQLGPLGRQAATARRAAVIQADARDARLRLTADDLVQLTSALAQEVADEQRLAQRREQVEKQLEAARERCAVAEEAAARTAPEVQRVQAQWFEVTALSERLSGLASLAAERMRLLARDPSEEGRHAKDPQQLRDLAARARADEEDLTSQIDALTEELSDAVTERTRVEGEFVAERDRLSQVERGAADRREGLARLTGQVAAKRGRIDAAEAEIGRLEEAAERAAQRAAEAERQFTRLEVSVAQDEEGEEGLDAAYEEAAAALELARERAEDLRRQERLAERERSAAQGRVEALDMALRRKDGTGLVLAWQKEGDGIGVLGSVATLVNVADGYETAVAAALGWAADAVALTSVDDAVHAVQRLREQSGGRAAMVVTDTVADPRPRTQIDVMDGVVWASEVVTCPDSVRAAMEMLLHDIVVVTDTPSALQTRNDFPWVTAVTMDGDVFAPGVVRGGSPDAPSVLEVQAEADHAREAVTEAGFRREQARFALAEVESQIEGLGQEVEAALADLHASDARITAVAEQLGSLGQQVRAGRVEADRARAQIRQVEVTLVSGRAELAQLAARLESARAQQREPEQNSPELRDQLEQQAAAARTRETEIRLTLRGREERLRAVAGRADSLEAQARAEEAARERAAQRRQRREHQAAQAHSVQVAAQRAMARLEVVAGHAEVAKGEARARQVLSEEHVLLARTAVDELVEEIRVLTDSAHRDEMVRAEQRMRIDVVETKAATELGVDPHTLIEEFGPHQPVPLWEETEGAEPQLSDRTRPYVRAEQEKRLRTAERGLARLGKINPLALEEFAALEERHSFLAEQLEDLQRGKQDLLAIVKEVDERVERVFAEAFADTAREFEGVFTRLFPGGEGRLVLTDPTDLLATGIEVEARPPGKRIKRLSLLSGGERSLTAVALLVAIFKARPSPFYIMDEVEAALDDTNLGRLISLFEELRDSSQLIVITHQKRTMEVADALYGVTMRGDGVTTVISQRMRDVAVSAPPG
ncbi:Chromosome partition protein Smc [Austwickia sp. TVS 96-490-7B]|uniref:chromosome segregation protein SMC n=1 Tax=Austwickia sp. TVS 96-490-7B TaxID=2830843 RepID=UPI001C596062|nr:chromosome segregation protein SMC [Austwickia sp. TVS 96-490-7B]MBW3085804.1 Chromosome partition protein Smc [Austwickia sp. TVS 96-490-7B]